MGLTGVRFKAETNYFFFRFRKTFKLGLELNGKRGEGGGGIFPRAESHLGVKMNTYVNVVSG
jgi:hypothetical protein